MAADEAEGEAAICQHGQGPAEMGQSWSREGREGELTIYRTDKPDFAGIDVGFCREPFP